MYAKKHYMSVEFEMIRWVVTMVLAGILALAVARTAWGLDAAGQPLPGPLPDNTSDFALPSSETSVRSDDVGTEFSSEDLIANDDVQLVRQLWSVLAFHEGDDPSAAREVWYAIQLAPENEAWQYVALGVTYLQEGDCKAAGAAFEVARDQQPNNPVPSYYMAIVRLTQAQSARDWYDVPVPKFQFAGLETPDVVPNSKAMYERVAMGEFSRAIELAQYVVLDQPLVGHRPIDRQALNLETPERSPNVGDLLTALGADNFAGKAHCTLGSMLVQRGALDGAEKHLDQAAATGLTIVHGYADLGAVFQSEGRHRDAVRAYMKAVAQGDRSPQTANGVIENFGKSLFDAR